MGQCQALDDTIRRYGRVFQAGTQRRSVPNFQFANHLVHSGRLGRLHTMHASCYRPRVTFEWLPAEPEPPGRMRLEPGSGHPRGAPTTGPM
jgi:predicted dehydrogenase